MGHLKPQSHRQWYSSFNKATPPNIPLNGSNNWEPNIQVYESMNVILIDVTIEALKKMQYPFIQQVCWHLPVERNTAIIAAVAQKSLEIYRELRQMSQQLLRRMRCKFAVEGRMGRDRYLVREGSSSLESPGSTL